MHPFTYKNHTYPFVLFKAFYDQNITTQHTTMTTDGGDGGVVVVVKYKECMKNHAAAMGGNATDGCGEFMEGTVEALTCSACNCHRNFHRKQELHCNPDGDGYVVDEKRKRRKRFRTKFSEEQKEKLLSFAEMVGWKIHKVDEVVVGRFCQETGIKRRVLKVWMHNNKHSLAAKHFS